MQLGPGDDCDGFCTSSAIGALDSFGFPANLINQVCDMAPANALAFKFHDHQEIGGVLLVCNAVG